MLVTQQSAQEQQQVWPGNAEQQASTGARFSGDLVDLKQETQVQPGDTSMWARSAFHYLLSMR